MRSYFPLRPISVALILALAGCEGLPGLEGGGETAPAATPSDEGAPGILRIEEREVERPDIYSAKARGLWDGRFSLGGRWVAVEEKVDAEQVRITNLDNGKVIEGALFPREFELPGPPIMVSMDAAVALEMQAGSPANLEVVVIRTETVEIPAPPPPAAPKPEEKPKPTADAPADDKKKPAAGIETGGVATTALAAAPAAAAAGAAPAAPSQARIQVAGGANKSGAEAVAAKLKDADIPATVAVSTANGKPFYRVIAGPFKTTADRNAALAAIKKLGYSDAFLVK